MRPTPDAIRYRRVQYRRRLFSFILVKTTDSTRDTYRRRVLVGSTTSFFTHRIRICSPFSDMRYGFGLVVLVLFVLRRNTGVHHLSEFS